MNDKIWQILQRSLENYSHSIVDDFVEVNVNFRSKSGMKTQIVRREVKNCCAWCKSLAGVYDYDNAPREIYMRHDNCSCLVTFVSDKKYIDVWSKKEYKSQKEARIARLNDINHKQNLNDEIGLLKRKARNQGYYAVDVTDAWIELNKIPKQGVVINDSIKIDGVTYFVDGKNVVQDHDQRERKIADMIFSELGGKIELMPRVNSPENVKCADYVINGLKWDLKSPTGSGKNTIKSNITSAKGQAYNVILNITDCPISLEDIEKYAIDAFRYHHNDFVQTVMIVNEKEILKVIERA